MEYKEAVTEARTLVRRSEDDQWRLAQLTWEQVEGGATRREWAKDVGVDERHVGRLYQVWLKWGEADDRPRFADAYAAEKRSGLDPFEGSTLDRVQQSRQVVRNLPPAQKAEVIREAMADLPAEQTASVARQALAQPEVADRVLRDRDTRDTVRRADDRYHVDHQREARERYDLAEPRSAQIGAMTAGEYDLTKARRGFEDALDNATTLEAHGWPDESRERFTALTRRALAAGEALLAKLEGRDLDAELADLLEGGEQP